MPQISILKPVIFFADICRGEAIGASLCFAGKDTLIWQALGSDLRKVKNLHFECCYYQGIEYCIENNIKYFDPGVQGEHKIRRGFQPQIDSSFHYFLKDDFGEAVAISVNQKEHKLKIILRPANPIHHLTKIIELNK